MFKVTTPIVSKARAWCKPVSTMEVKKCFLFPRTLHLLFRCEVLENIDPGGYSAGMGSGVVSSDCRA